MKITILYESYFGNTLEIAKAIGNSLQKNYKVKIHQVSETVWNEISDFDFLITGAPTRGFRPGEQTARFLKSIPRNGLKNKKVAAFDTRLSLPAIHSKMLQFIVKTGGYAAKDIAKALKKKGGELAADPEGFLVSGEKGPLVEGELNRAEQWAERIVK